LRKPISRVRSETLTSMMFMIPTPPTSSEIADDAGGDQRHHRRDLVELLDDALGGHAPGRCLLPGLMRRFCRR
jgi:hypothetical protein